MNIRFKRFTFSLLSPLLGVHIGKNPASGQRFMHVAPLPFFGIDFEFPPFDQNEEYQEYSAKYIYTPVTHMAMARWWVEEQIANGKYLDLVMVGGPSCPSFDCTHEWCSAIRQARDNDTMKGIKL
jgi:hypothetical protein